jgi:hypothetical protein
MHKHMILLENIYQFMTQKRPQAAALLAALALSGCISSSGPLLTDAKPLIGMAGTLHIFSLTDGSARDPSRLSFSWNGSRYLVRGPGRDFSDFTVHPFEGRDLIVQSTATRRPRPTEYALARRLADGTYLVIPINQEDADAPTQERFCTKTQDASCRVNTIEQMFVFARATADKVQTTGGLAVVVPAKPR